MQESKMPAKKSYEPPQLVVHGPVGKITGFDLDDLGMLGPDRNPSSRGPISSAGKS